MKILMSILMIIITSQLWSQSKLIQSEIQVVALQSSNSAHLLKGNISFYTSPFVDDDGQRFIPGMVYQLNSETDKHVPLSFGTNHLSIYPNPTAGYVFIAAEWGQPQKTELLTLDGRLIRELATAESKIDLNEVMSGTYILRVFNGISTTSHRIVKE